MTKRLLGFALCLTAARAFAGPASISLQASFSQSTGANDNFGAAVTDAAGRTCVVYDDGDKGIRVVAFNGATGATSAPVDLATGRNISWSIGLAMDAFGNYYLGGRGDNGSNDKLGLAKFDATGALVWQTMSGGAGDEEALRAGTGLDGSGNAYVIGQLGGSNGIYSCCGRKTIVMKVNGSGAYQWTYTFTGGNDNIPYAMVTDPAGGVYTLRSESDPSAFCSTAWVDRINAGGSLVWSRTIGVCMYVSGLALNGGALYVATSNAGVTVLKLDAASGDDLTSGSYSSFSATQFTSASLAVDPAGNVYVGGLAHPAGNRDIGAVVAFKPDLSGTQWVSLDDLGYDEGNTFNHSTTIDSSGNVYLSGGSTSNTGSCSLPSDLVVRKFSPPGGAVAWSRQFDGPIHPVLQGAARDASGNIYISTKHPSLLLKYDAAFALQWSRSLAATMFCDADFGKPTFSAGFVYLPFSASPSCTVNCGNNDIALIGKFDAATGTNTALYGAPTVGSANDLGGCVVAGGNLYFVVGTKTTTGSQVEVVKLNGSGIWQWTTVVTPVLFTAGFPVAADSAGNILTAYPGFSTSWFTGAEAIFAGISKVDGASGAVIWTRSFTLGDNFSFPAGIATSGTTVYLASGESNLLFSPLTAPTSARAVLRRLDANGALVWTRSTDLGAQAGFTGVSEVGGTVYVAGSVGTSWVIGDGIHLADGDTFAQAYAADAVCGAPLWTARYDTGAIDEGIDILPASRVVISGGASVNLLQYTEGVPDAATPVSTVVVTPSPAEVGQVVTVKLTVSNAGGRDALSVSTTLMINSGAAGLTALLGAPAQVFDLISGQSRSFTWSATATAQATVIITATATGTEACTGTTRVGGTANMLLTGYKSVLAPGATFSRTSLGIGDWVKVSVTLSNTGAAGALLNAVSGTVTTVSGGPASLVPGMNGSIAAMNAGSSTVFNWTFSVSGAGNLIFSMSGTGTDPIFGPLLINGGSPVIPVYDQARLTATPLMGPQSTASVGQWIQVGFSVTNWGSYDATNVTATLFVGPGANLLSFVSAPAPVTVPANGNAWLVWTFSVSGAGAVTVTASVTGTDTSPLGYGVRTIATTNGMMQTPPNLAGYAAQYATTVEVGMPIYATLTLSNTGDASVYIGSNGNKIYEVGAGTVSGPINLTPAFQSVLSGHQIITYTLTVTALSPGLHAWTGSLTGVDGNSGASVYSPSYPVCPNVTIQAAPALTGAIVLSPSNLHQPQTLLVCMTVSNSGGTTATLVQPSATLLFAGSGGASRLAGPYPGPATLAPGSKIVFTWTLSSDAPGTLAVTNSATGISILSGNTAWTGPATSNAVVIEQALSTAISASTTTLKGGQTSVVTMTITNSGSFEIDAIAPSLAMGPTIYASAGPPSQTGFNLLPGESINVTWNLSGIETGTASVTAYASGIDPNDSSVVSTQASLNVDVKSSLGSGLVFVPGTVKEGETFEIDYTVTKNGLSLATNVLPIGRPFVSDGTLVEYVSGPTPPSKTPLAGGTSVTFKWTYRAAKAGTVTFTATATATVSAALEFTQSAASIVIKKLVDIPAFEGETLVYPNPVTGDQINLAVRMQDPMSKVELDVYNTGFQRVYHGEWPALPQGDSLLEIVGAKLWAPGTYVVRVTATRAAGGTQSFKNFRIAVKH